MREDKKLLSSSELENGVKSLLQRKNISFCSNNSCAHDPGAVMAAAFGFIQLLIMLKDSGKTNKNTSDIISHGAQFHCYSD